VTIDALSAENVASDHLIIVDMLRQ